MPQWNPSLYLEFDAERTRASIDLAARLDLAEPADIVDLGCGPGNSTAVLEGRWPQSRITGVDSSAEMLDRARARFPGIRWVQDDIARWNPAEQYDLVFTNAALQWVPDHAHLLPRILGRVRPGGRFAMQIPFHLQSRVHRLIEGTAARFGCPPHTFEILMPGEYYDIVAPHAKAIHVWITEYIHVMERVLDIVRWMRGTGLRPYLERLSGAEQPAFLDAFARAVEDEYPRQADGRVLFPFPRLFLTASV